MAYPNFPALSHGPEYPLKESRVDQALKSESEKGYVLARPRFTRTRKRFHVTYNVLEQEDKDALESFVETVKGDTGIFTWTHPQSGATYNVRFSKTPEFELWTMRLWKTELELETV